MNNKIEIFKSVGGWRDSAANRYWNRFNIFLTIHTGLWAILFLSKPPLLIKDKIYLGSISVRVACSFAQLKNSDQFAYVFVFALPYITNRISINSEHDLVNVRLLSICPPDALRPYYQDGYLAGTEDITTDYESKTELDFKNRLIAKFRIPSGSRFWGKGFSSIPEPVLYPRADRIEKLCASLQVTLETELQPGEIGEFLKLWTSLEEHLLELTKKLELRRFSAREAISALGKRRQLPKDLIFELDTLRRFRNQVVHKPKSIEPGEIQEFITRLRNVFSQIL